MKNPNKNNSHSRDKKWGTTDDHVVLWVTAVLCILESKSSLNLSDARKNLILLKDNSYWIWVHRHLELHKSSELYYRLAKYKNAIQLILNAWLIQVANDDIYISLEQPTPYRWNTSKELPLPTQEEVVSDIELLFSTHLPGVSKAEYETDLWLFIGILINNIKTGHQYEIRLAEYLADSWKFQEDFLPWYNSIII